MIPPATARDEYVVPALRATGLYSPAAERVLMGTAAIESGLVDFVQLGGGPARGMFQMEPPTFAWLLDSFLAEPGRQALRASVLALAGSESPEVDELVGNHLFAAAMARIKYLSVPGAIPESVEDQAQYWWTFYNGRSPRGLKPANYMSRWALYCSGLYTDTPAPA